MDQSSKLHFLTLPLFRQLGYFQVRLNHQSLSLQLLVLKLYISMLLFPLSLVMGQEAGKPAWPKPPGGHQTITGRRYGRRHAYVSFRPTSAKHRNLASVEGWTATEMDGVHRAHSIRTFTVQIHLLCAISSPICSALISWGTRCMLFESEEHMIQVYISAC